MSLDRDTVTPIQPDRVNGPAGLAPAARDAATVIDVARVAGVSRQTVSRVLNDSPKVTSTTRARVLDAMRSLGYQRNEVASSLRTGRTRTLGLLLTNVMNPYLSTELRAIQDTVERHGYRVIVYNTDEELAKEERYLRILREQRVDGIFLVEVGPEVEQLAVEQASDGTPIIVLNRIVSSVDSVSIDTRPGARLATEHLLAHGHQRIGLILAARYAQRSPRVAGYREALAAHGLAYGADLVTAAFDTPDDGRLAVGRLLAADPPPTALITGGYMVTLGTLEALRERGLRSGRDIAVISNGFISWAPFVDPPLTTVSVDPYLLGSEGAEVLLDRLNGNLPVEPVQRILPFIFKVRDSCGGHDASGAPLVDARLAAPRPEGAARPANRVGR
jgi:DNA-binding LacI/PurR family transcriptional regulator